MRKIINSDGHEVCDETEIRQKLKQFYSSLYKRSINETVDECMSYLANMSLPELTDEEKLSCEGKLTKMNAGSHFLPWEMTRARGTMVCLKSFIFFFYEIDNYILESLNYSFIHGQLSHSQRQAMITLIRVVDFLYSTRPIACITMLFYNKRKKNKVLDFSCGIM